MIQASVAAFLATYISLFQTIGYGFFTLFLIPVILILFVYLKQFRVFLVVFIFFYVWSQQAIQIQQAQQYDINKKATVTLLLEISDLPQYKTNSISFLAKPIKVINAANNDFDFMRLKKIKLNWYNTDTALYAGQTWQMTVRIQPPHGYQNGAGFDYERWMFVNQISATGYVVAKTPPVLKKAYTKDFVLIIRSWLLQKVRLYSHHLDNSPLFQALSLADKSELSAELKDLFVDTGTAHLLVISGLHVGLFSLLFYFLAARFWMFYSNYRAVSLNRHDFAVIWAWLAALIYATLAGFSIPTLRALIMLSVVYLLLLRRQKISFLQVFCSAIVVVLLIQPLSLLSYSFWLSFLAILLIIISQFRLKKLSKLQSILVLQLLFSVLFIPLNAVVFDQIIISSFFANLVLIPVMGFVVIPLNLLSTFLAAVDWPYVSYLYEFLDSTLSLLIDYLKLLKDIFGSSHSVRNYPIWLMLISFFGLSLLVFFPRRKIVVTAFFISFIPWFFMPKGLMPNEVEIQFFDIGSGTSVLIQTANHSLLYDLGPGNNKGYQPAAWVIKPFIQSVGIKAFDKIVISHSDQDHYGGYWGLKEHGLIKNKVILGGNINKLKTVLKPKEAVLNCHQYPAWYWDKVYFEFVPLEPNKYLKDNNQSCVLRISNSSFRVLLAGDIEAKREQGLVDNYSEYLKADVLLAPHHGSNTSSTRSFLKAVDPSLAIITTGFLNKWGFPKENIIKRYQQLGINTLNTAVVGGIKVKLDNKEVLTSPHRDSKREIWY
ncbi:MAG: DNA internalization-related competence protein ComEC/Rec2 [Gammaproteobacteria bacterium]|nr:DNA internalization-related competence protein ComEC/Rec2 [Gammaproteobacteria bacterium]